MKKSLQYSDKNSINGYDESLIAKTEKNDCTVRAIASSTGLTYDKAHALLAKKFNRINGKGVFFSVGMAKIKRINNKTIKKLDREYLKRNKCTTVGSFVKSHSVGTYIINVKRHVFTIKDSVVIGNVGDAKKLRKIVYCVWKVGK